MPEPDDNTNDNREEEGFQWKPHFGEASILIDGNHPHISNGPQTTIIFIDDRESNIQKVEIVV